MLSNINSEDMEIWPFAQSNILDLEMLTNSRLPLCINLGQKLFGVQISLHLNPRLIDDLCWTRSLRMTNCGYKAAKLSLIGAFPDRKKKYHNSYSLITSMLREFSFGFMPLPRLSTLLQCLRTSGLFITVTNQSSVL